MLQFSQQHPPWTPFLSLQISGKLLDPLFSYFTILKKISAPRKLVLQGEISQSRPFCEILLLLYRKCISFLMGKYFPCTEHKLQLPLANPSPNVVGLFTLSITIVSLLQRMWHVQLFSSSLYPHNDLGRYGRSSRVGRKFLHLLCSKCSGQSFNQPPYSTPLPTWELPFVLHRFVWLVTISARDNDICKNFFHSPGNCIVAQLVSFVYITCHCNTM